MKLSFNKSSLRSIYAYSMQILGITMIIVGVYLVASPFINFVDGTSSNAEIEEFDFSPSIAQEPVVVDSSSPSILEGLSTNRVQAGGFTAIEKAQSTAEIISKTGQWAATDYSIGDIMSGSYEVQLGDTLWEIAEAVYGNGSQWHQILNANIDSIGFLPDGSNALILPGQILQIPSM